MKRLARLIQLLDFNRTIRLEQDLARTEALLRSAADDTRRLAESTIGLVKTVDIAAGSFADISTNLATARDYLDSGRTGDARVIIAALFCILDGASKRKVN